MQNCSGCLAWARFSSSIWPSNFIEHLHYSSSGAPNPVLWDMANRFAAAGPGTTCHQPGAFVKRPQVDRRFTMEPEWQGDSDLVNHLERFHVSFLRCNPRHYGSSVITRQKKPPPAANCWPNPSVPGERRPSKLLVWKTAGMTQW